MRIEKFEDIVAWQKAKELSLFVYGLSKKNKDFGRDYGFKDQIQRASVSIMNNIAEGFERQSLKEFHKFLYVAKGSASEVRSMLHVAKDLGYISEADFGRGFGLSVTISKLLSNFIKYLKSR